MRQTLLHFVAIFSLIFMAGMPAAASTEQIRSASSMCREATLVVHAYSAAQHVEVIDGRERTITDVEVIQVFKGHFAKQTLRVSQIGTREQPIIGVKLIPAQREMLLYLIQKKNGDFIQLGLRNGRIDAPADYSDRVDTKSVDIDKTHFAKALRRAETCGKEVVRERELLPLREAVRLKKARKRLPRAQKPVHHHGGGQ